MCGIVGVVDSRPDSTVDPAVITRMLKSIVHRGPDEAGTYDGGRVGLGTQRLKIIDLQGGHQPMSNEDNTVWVAFNGEIYNYLSLRGQCGTKKFLSQSDTEVVLRLYLTMGIQCVEQFAFTTTFYFVPFPLW